MPRSGVHYTSATMSLRTALLLLALMVSVTSSVSTDRGTYIVHMDKSKIKSLETMKWHEYVMDSVHKLSIQENKEEEAYPPNVLYVYETTMFGFSATLTKSNLRSLDKINGFLYAIPDEMLSLHTTHSPGFLGLNPGSGLWHPKNLASDVIIGVLDTGIWPEHISFFDTGMPPVPSNWKGKCEEGTNFTISNCNRKLIGARAFFKGYESVRGTINETEDYRSPRDAEGHGTHTASTAAGNLVPGASFFGNAKGAATGMMFTARIAAYKVCYAFGCSSSDILAAMDTAVSDGVNILSLSLGGIAKPYYGDSIAIAALGAFQQGVFVSCSAGNSGPYSSTVGNVAPWIMTVGASSLDRSFPTTVKLGDGQQFKGASLYSGKNIKSLQLVYGATAGIQGAQYCSNGSLTPELVKGKIVVCQRGGNSRAKKAEQVMFAGGAAMLLVNTDNEGEDIFADPHIIPATSLGALAGNAIKKYVNSTRQPSASITFEGTTYKNVAPVMAAFSSRGPSFIGPDIIKPDVTAPGVNILAAWPPNISPLQLKSDNRSVIFNIISGTSMSCPHVSGLAALIKAAHKDWSPAAIKSALMTTAYTVDSKESPIGDTGSTDGYATPFAYGSGHVDPEKASNPGLIYDITTIDIQNYLCSLKYNSTQLALLSRGNLSCPGHSKHVQSRNLNYPSFAVTFSKKASKNVTITHKRTVTNVGTAKSVYVAQVIAPSGTSVRVKPKALHFSSVGMKLNYQVSFTTVGQRPGPGSSSFGSLTFTSGKFKVRSPIAVTCK
ncbi:subtilisin-like protease SBT1.1 isoform X1 [Daucus carota subsp. sativus]|nr:PREDICTED: subtilisin-like protease SBT1.1 isoform X1 [Daucus carota subsp. sativus]